MIPWFLSQGAAAPSTLPAAAEDWFATASLPPEWTLSRPAAALGRGTDGRWASYAADLPRPFHDPSTLAYRGILVEGAAATQIVHRSRSPAGAVGVAANAATISTDASVQTPFGMGCTRIVPTTANAQHGFNSTFGGAEGAAVADGATVTIRAVAKPLGTAYPNIEFFLRDRAGAYRAVSFSLAGPGSVLANANALAATIRADTDGFYEILITAGVGTGTSSPACNMLVEPAAGTRNYAGDGTSGTLLAYLGAEAAGEASSPILTDTGSATRPAETLSSSTEWLGPGPRSFALRYAPLSAGAQTVLHASGPDLVELRHGTGTVTYVAMAGGAASAQITAAAPAPGVERTAVLVAALNEFRLAQDGATVGTDSTGNVPAALPAMRIGSGAGGAGAGALLLRRMKYWRDGLSGPEAEAFSGDITIPGAAPAVPVLDIQAARTATPAETTVTLVVTLTGEPTGPSVGWRTVNGTATAGTDFVGAGGVARFAPGAYSAQVTVALAARSTEADRTFAIELTGPDGATLGTARCTVTLQRVVQQGPAAAVQNTFGATLPPEWTLTRASPARTRNSAGNWVAVNANVHRHHYLAPGVSGLLVQSATSEQRLYDAVNPGWTATASTVVLDTTTATAFGSRSVKWRKDDSVGAHLLAVELLPAKCDMPTGEFSLGMTVRPHGERYWSVVTKGIDNVWKEAVYDLDAAGAVVYQDSGALATVERDPFFTDTYNLTLNRSQAATAGVNAEIQVFPCDAFGNLASGGGTSRGIDVLHMQLEPGPSVGVPIVTTGTETAKVTRFGDVLKATGTWFQRQSYSLGIRYVRLRPAPDVQTVLHVRDTANSTTADAQHLLVESGELILRPRTGSTTLATVIDGGPVPTGVLRTSLLVVDHDLRMALFDAGAKVGEVPVGTGGVAAPLAPTILRFGSTEPGASNGASWVLQAAYLWNDPLDDADAALFSGNLAYSPPEDAGPPVVSIPTAMAVREGEALAVPVTKTVGGACSVTFRTRALSGGATWSTDYTGVETTVSFTSAETLKTVDVATVADSVADPGETLSILLENPVGCTLGNAVGTVTINELPTVTIPASATVAEGSAVSVPLSKAGTGACSVSVQTQQATATVGVDYTGWNPTTISFAADETTKTVTVQTTADAATEPAETFNIAVSAPSGCVLGNATCTVTIAGAGTGGSVDTTYPTPQGFGTSGNFGLGGDVYRVTSLADNLSPTQGMLRHALLTAGTGGRLVVFEVAGIIRPVDRLRIGLVSAVSGLTIAGETAPWPGVTVQPVPNWNGPTFTLYDARNINISHIHVERPYADIKVDDTNFDNWDTEPGSNQRCENIWLDHISSFWSFDEGITLWTGPGPFVLQNISITNSMFCEPLGDVRVSGGTNPLRKSGQIASDYDQWHNFNMLLGAYGKRVDVQHCLFSEGSWRNPWIDAGTEAVVANNVSLNCDNNCHVTMNDWAAIERNLKMKATCVGYLAISGPNTPLNNKVFRLNRVVSTGHQAYASNLYAWQGAGARGTPDATVPTDPAVMMSTRPIDTPVPVVALTAQQIYDRALANVGPRPKERGIATISKQIDKLRNKSGRWVSLPSDVGGPVSYAAVTRSLGAAGASSSPGNFRSGDPIPPMPAAGNATAMRAYIRAFKDQVQFD